MTRDFSGSRPWESIASRRAGLKRDCPTKKSYVAVLTVSTHSTRFCSADEFSANNSAANAAGCTVVWNCIPLLVEARIHQLWRTDRPNRDYADGAGRKEKMDQPIAISARAQLLHAAARPGSTTARHLRRLASSQNLGRHRRRRILCHTVDFYSLDVEFHLRRLRQRPVDRSDFLWTQTCRDCDRADGGHSHREKIAEERSHVGAGCARFHSDLFFQSAISRDRPQRWYRWISRWIALEIKIRERIERAFSIDIVRDRRRRGIAPAYETKFGARVSDLGSLADAMVGADIDRRWDARLGEHAL